MEKEKSNLTVITITIVGVILLVVLSLIFVGRGDDATETPAETSATQQDADQADAEDSENGAVEDTDNQDAGTNLDSDAQAGDDSETQTQSPDEAGDTDASIEPSDSLTEETPLPVNWDELSDKEKIALNPFDCDLETQTIYADDGSCHSKNPNPLPETDSQAPLRLVSGLSRGLGLNYVWSPPELDCNNTVEVDVEYLCSVTLLFEGIANSDEFQNSPSDYLRGIEYDDGLACLKLNYGFLTLHVESELVPGLYDAHQTIPSYIYPHSDESPYSEADCATEIQKGQFYAVSFFPLDSPELMELDLLARAELQTTPLNTIEPLIVWSLSPSTPPSFF